MFCSQQEDSEPADLDYSQQRDVNNTSADATSQNVTPSPIARKENLTPADERLKEIRPDDEFEAYGKYVRSLQGKQAIFAQKLINDLIFEGELEALTKDFKVMNSQPHRSFESHDYQQFNPQLYRQQPQTHHTSLKYQTINSHTLMYPTLNNTILVRPVIMFYSLITQYSQTHRHYSSKLSTMILPNYLNCQILKQTILNKPTLSNPILNNHNLNNPILDNLKLNNPLIQSTVNQWIIVLRPSFHISRRSRT